jgi:Na+:H+ antiporter, NhaA family
MKNSSSKLVDVATVVASACAIVVTGFVVRDALFSGGASARRFEAENRHIADWREYSSGGHRIGPSNAATTIVEFGDYQCRACMALAPVLEAVLSAHPDVALIYRHYPLPQHPLAYPSARAAVCVSHQDRFEAFHRLLYEKIDSIGLLSFAEIARRAGATDLSQFESCFSEKDQVPAIERDVAAGQRLGIKGTPTLLINDLLVTGPLDSVALERIIRDGRQ